MLRIGLRIIENPAVNFEKLSMMDTPTLILAESYAFTSLPLRRVLTATSVLMKEDFGVWKCNVSSTRYYPFPLWYDLNGGARLSHGQSQIRAWYPQRAEKHHRRQKHPVPIARGMRVSPESGENFSLITGREKHAQPKMYHIDDTAIFVVRETRWFIVSHADHSFIEIDANTSTKSIGYYFHYFYKAIISSALSIDWWIWCWY